MKKDHRQMLFDLLERLAHGIVAVVGPHCEVVVYDFADLEHSVVAVAGNVTGRRPGAPVPDLSFVPDRLSPQTPDLLNYRSIHGAQALNSSTIWIRDNEGVPIGAIGINVDYSTLLQVRDLLEQVAAPARAVAEMVVSDTFAKDLDELIELSVADFLRREGASEIDDLGREDKLRLIDLLEARGLFRIRGAVNRVASLLNVSRATVYNLRSAAQEDESPDELD